MYRVKVQPLFEKSVFKPVDSELVIDREYGNVSIYDEKQDKLISATKNKRRELDETIVKYNIIKNNLTVMNGNTEVDISETELNKYQKTFIKILSYFRLYIELIKIERTLLNNLNDLIDLSYFQYSVIYKTYLDTTLEINKQTNLARNKLYKSIILMETMKGLLDKEPDSLKTSMTNEEYNTIKNIEYKDSIDNTMKNVFSNKITSSNLFIINNNYLESNTDGKFKFTKDGNYYDKIGIPNNVDGNLNNSSPFLLDNSKRGKFSRITSTTNNSTKYLITEDAIDLTNIYPEYEYRISGNSVYKKDRGEIYYMNQRINELMKYGVYNKYIKLADRMKEIYHLILTKVNKNEYEKFLNTLKYGDNKSNEIKYGYYNTNVFLNVIHDSLIKSKKTNSNIWKEYEQYFLRNLEFPDSDEIESNNNNEVIKDIQLNSDGTGKIKLTVTHEKWIDKNNNHKVDVGETTEPIETDIIATITSSQLTVNNVDINIWRPESTLSNTGINIWDAHKEKRKDHLNVKFK